MMRRTGAKKTGPKRTTRRLKPKPISKQKALEETQKPVVSTAEENMTPGFMKPGLLKRSKRKRIKSV
jgi:hypothetical protein